MELPGPRPIALGGQATSSRARCSRDGARFHTGRRRRPADAVDLFRDLAAPGVERRAAADHRLTLTCRRFELTPRADVAPSCGAIDASESRSFAALPVDHVEDSRTEPIARCGGWQNPGGVDHAFTALIRGSRSSSRFDSRSRLIPLLIRRETLGRNDERGRRPARLGESCAYSLAVHADAVVVSRSTSPSPRPAVD